MIEPELFDTVELLVDLPEPNLRAGKRGAIVHVHSDDMFEVEFVTDAADLCGRFRVDGLLFAEVLVSLSLCIKILTKAVLKYPWTGRVINRSF